MRRIALAATLLLLAGCSKECESGQARCGAVGTSAREVCKDSGDGWAALPCGEKEVCSVQGTTAACQVAACQAAEYRCGADNQREVCSADRLGFSPSPCSGEEACVTRDVMSTDDGCEPRICTPGKLVCKGTGITSDREQCHGTGVKWMSRPCLVSEVCVPVTAMLAQCRPGVCAADRCSDDRRSRFACEDFGTVETAVACAAGTACAPDGASVACKPIVCPAGAARCPKGVGASERESCDASGTGWVLEKCAVGDVCSPAGACAPRVCSAGQKKCSPGFSEIIQCDTSETTWVGVPCGSTEACQAAACKPGATPFGDVASLTSGTYTLMPGDYTMAVVDVDGSGRDSLSYPVSLTGDVTSAPLPPDSDSDSRGGASAQPRLLPESPYAALRRALLTDVVANPGVVEPPGPAPLRAIGDTRTFKVRSEGSVLQRTAKLVAIGALVNLWEDQTVKSAGGNLNPSLIASLQSSLDAAVLPRARGIYNSNPDVDGNGKFDVLFTDLLPSATAGAFVSLLTLYNPAYTGNQYDFGEVAYCRPLRSSTDVSDIASTLGHEFAHLLEFYRRAQPYLASGPNALPGWVFQANYLHEGAAELAENWGGHSEPWVQVLALENPSRISLNTLAVTDYLPDSTDSGVGYGQASLVVEYAFDQAGAIQIQQPGTILDRGGRAWIEAFLARRDDLNRPAPLDGRAVAQWWPDFASALLVTTLDGKLSATAPAATNARYRFVKATKDPYGGFLGAGLRYEEVKGSGKSGAILKPVPWRLHPLTMLRGGLSFVTFRVSEKTAKMVVSGSSTVVRLIRYEAK